MRAISGDGDSCVSSCNCSRAASGCPTRIATVSVRALSRKWPRAMPSVAAATITSAASEERPSACSNHASHSARCKITLASLACSAETSPSSSRAAAGSPHCASTVACKAIAVPSSPVKSRHFNCSTARAANECASLNRPSCTRTIARAYDQTPAESAKRSSRRCAAKSLASPISPEATSARNSERSRSAPAKGASKRKASASGRVCSIAAKASVGLPAIVAIIAAVSPALTAPSPPSGDTGSATSAKA